MAEKKIENIELVEAHAHIGRDNGREVKNPCREVFEAIFKLYAVQGITNIRDGGDEQGMGIAAREVAKEMGIHFKTPIYALSKTGGYGAFLGVQASSIKEIKKILSMLVQQGADFIKVIQSGIVDFDVYGNISEGGFLKKELEYITAFAKDAGLPVMAHCNGVKNIEIAIDAGVDSIEHGYFICDEQLYAMAEKSIAWTPTFSPLVNYRRTLGQSNPQAEIIKKTLLGHAESLRRAVNLGATVATGSDAGAPFVGHGSGAADELMYFIEEGIASKDIARMTSEFKSRLM